MQSLHTHSTPFPLAFLNEFTSFGRDVLKETVITCHKHVTLLIERHSRQTEKVSDVLLKDYFPFDVAGDQVCTRQYCVFHCYMLSNKTR